MKLYRSKPPKPQRIFTTNFRRQRTFIQIIFTSLKFQLELSFKASRNFKDFDPLKLYWIQALKPWKTFTTNLRRSRTFEESTKNMKNAKNKKSLTSTQLEIHHNFIPKIFQSTFQSKWRTSRVWVKTTSTEYLNWRLF